MESVYLELLPACVSAGVARHRVVDMARDGPPRRPTLPGLVEVDEEDSNEDEDWDDAEDWDEDEEDAGDGGDGGVAHAPGVVQFSRPFPLDTRPRIVRCAQLVF